MAWFLYLLATAPVLFGTTTQATAIPLQEQSVTRATSSPLELLDQLSVCALQCIIDHAPTVGCDFLDIDCQCASEPLYEILAGCVVDNCTIEEAIGLAKVDAKQCHRPTDSRLPMVAGSAIASAVVIFGAYVLRMISRLTITRYCWWDDFFHTLSIMFVIPMTVVANMLATHGFGKHLFEIEPQNAPKLWKWFYIAQILWAFNILALKISILCLYLRLFPSKRFRLLIIGSLAALVAVSLALIGLDIFQCSPVSAAWTLQHGEARCMDLAAVALANAGVNIGTEIAILIIPLPILVKLKLSFRKKAEVIALVMLGVIVIVVAAVRLPSLFTLKHLVDTTYTNAPAFLWTCLESTVAHVCAAAPAAKLLFTSAATKVTNSFKETGYISFGGNEDKSTRQGTRQTAAGDTIDLQPIDLKPLELGPLPPTAQALGREHRRTSLGFGRIRVDRVVETRWEPK